MYRYYCTEMHSLNVYANIFFMNEFLESARMHVSQRRSGTRFAEGKPISGIAILATDCRLIIRSQLFAPRGASQFSEGPRKNITQDANRLLRRPATREDSRFGPSSLGCTWCIIHGNADQNILRSMHPHFCLQNRYIIIILH